MASSGWLHTSHFNFCQLWSIRASNLRRRVDLREDQASNEFKRRSFVDKIPIQSSLCRFGFTSSDSCIVLLMQCLWLCGWGEGPFLDLVFGVVGGDSLGTRLQLWKHFSAKNENQFCARGAKTKGRGTNYFRGKGNPILELLCVPDLNLCTCRYVRVGVVLRVCMCMCVLANQNVYVDFFLLNWKQWGMHHTSVRVLWLFCITSANKSKHSWTNCWSIQVSWMTRPWLSCRRIAVALQTWTSPWTTRGRRDMLSLVRGNTKHPCTCLFGPVGCNVHKNNFLVRFDSVRDPGRKITLAGNGQNNNLNHIAMAYTAADVERSFSATLRSRTRETFTRLCASACATDACFHITFGIFVTQSCGSFQSRAQLYSADLTHERRTFAINRIALRGFTPCEDSKLHRSHDSWDQ